MNRAGCKYKFMNPLYIQEPLVIIIHHARDRGRSVYNLLLTCKICRNQIIDTDQYKYWSTHGRSIKNIFRYDLNLIAAPTLLRHVNSVKYLHGWRIANDSQNVPMIKLLENMITVRAGNDDIIYTIKSYHPYYTYMISSSELYVILHNIIRFANSKLIRSLKCTCKFINKIVASSQKSQSAKFTTGHKYGDRAQRYDYPITYVAALVDCVDIIPHKYQIIFAHYAQCIRAIGCAKMLYVFDICNVDPRKYYLNVPILIEELTDMFGFDVVRREAILLDRRLSLLIPLLLRQIAPHRIYGGLQFDELISWMQELRDGGATTDELIGCFMSSI